MWKEHFLHPFVHESRQMIHPALTKAFLQAAAAAAIHCQPEWCTHPPPTDNMRAKTDDAKGIIGCFGIVSY